MYDKTSIIVAPATTLGQSAIGIIRLSGPIETDKQKQAAILQILFKVFRAKYLSSADLNTNKEREERCCLKPWTLHRGVALDSHGQEIDDVLAVYMPGPRTFTGEDCVEIHCHGSRVILETVLEACLNAGARMALPGEFSYRAFMNGRIDLAQAEAVSELVSASSVQGARLAKAKLDGAFGQRIALLKEKLLSLKAKLCVVLDFSLELSGDELDNVSEAEIKQNIAELETGLKALTKAYQRARAWRDGCMVVLVGSVNAGKSSLMNAMLGRRRSLVHDIPGTTRDYIEESINLNGLNVRLVDTAGLRQTDDLVEADGVEFSRELLSQADYVLFVKDACFDLSEEEKELLLTHPDHILVLNKQDLLDTSRSIVYDACNTKIYISAKKSEGIDTLLDVLHEKLLLKMELGKSFEQNSDLAPNLRQNKLIQAALEELNLFDLDLENKMPIEILSVRIDIILDKLEEIIGKTDLDEVLEKVFGDFCIGK
ncbi:tRNA uridine-5-carboxymethylaminomethyl(34) synthesis GTPase MnmE [Desulfovibrio litoralis]|uniref:tRNA modification GTPase MnmE n=1 Tax=Desulfovibrio litoralis DSM 11393 TaxID=1121455 RepID=A0A1M7TKG6_9BACT|nr:tRNA uridine-5-carboxymethylaminomethyl(34) synthesis GTPase MnmE [Desulfovibrio litoralis]SHN71224.1 tRNA modification GTPase trmE [Desulfovibrio litoralis DSM 11393]